MSDDDFTIDYFGPANTRKEGERLVETPIGKPCMLCEEGVLAGDMGTINGLGQIMHYECQMRLVVGSVGHLMARCSCYGGTEEDPPGTSRRVAAKAATALWERQQELQREINEKYK